MQVASACLLRSNSAFVAQSRRLTVKEGVQVNILATQFVSACSSVYCLQSSVYGARFAMDPLSITAGIIAILQLTTKVIEYIEAVKDAPKERNQCAIEASNLIFLLTTLKCRLQERSSNERWYAEVRKLCEEHGLLNQYKLGLEQLLAKTQGGMRMAGHSMLWQFIKKDVMETLARIERLKTLVQIALEMDHM